jgi:hypothetical protein
LGAGGNLVAGGSKVAEGGFVYIRLIGSTEKDLLKKRALHRVNPVGIKFFKREYRRLSCPMSMRK